MMINENPYSDLKSPELYTKKRSVQSRSSHKSQSYKNATTKLSEKIA